MNLSNPEVSENIRAGINTFVQQRPDASVEEILGRVEQMMQDPVLTQPTPRGGTGGGASIQAPVEVEPDPLAGAPPEVRETLNRLQGTAQQLGLSTNSITGDSIPVGAMSTPDITTLVDEAMRMEALRLSIDLTQISEEGMNRHRS